MAGGLEKLAVASDIVPETTEEAQEDPVEEAESEQPQEKTMIAEERVVTVGIENREKVEIVDGLREGEYLVVLGYETLTDGVDVNISIREPNPLTGEEDVLGKENSASSS